MSKQLTLLLSGAILAIILFLLMFADKSSMIAVLNKNKLLPQPEQFTELYFENHELLPKQTLASDEAEFKFIVHNLEYKPITYSYEIEATSTESAKIIDNGSFTLQHDEYKTTVGNISTLETETKTQINVNLINKNQSIHFWVNSN